MSVRSILVKRLTGTFLFACMLLGVHSAAALANVASVSISAPNATQGVATSITVNGSSQLARNLYVYIDSSGYQCSSTPYNESFEDTTLANGTAIGPGAFSATHSYTPANANATYSVCAYVDDNTTNTPDATAKFVLSTIPPATPAKPKHAPKKSTPPATTRPKPKSGTHRGSSRPSGPIAISRSGQIGSLAINRSTASDIRGVWGSPDYTHTGNVGGGPSFPNYIELGYSCHPSRYTTCAISFFISQRTHLLESFTTASRLFTLFGGVRVGMASNAASRREHEPNLDGCGQAIYVNTRDLNVDVLTRGGHAHLTRQRELVSGGSVSGISIDHKRLGVGVNFC